MLIKTFTFYDRIKFRKICMYICFIVNLFISYIMGLVNKIETMPVILIEFI